MVAGDCHWVVMWVCICSIDCSYLGYGWRIVLHDLHELVGSPVSGLIRGKGD